MVENENEEERHKVNPLSGQPTKYREEYCAQLVRYFKDYETHEKRVVEEYLGGDGGDVRVTYEYIPKAPPSITKFAVIIEVHRDTLYEWRRKHRKFSDAFAMAKRIYKDIYIDGAILGRFNPFFTKLIMANRFEWTDKVDQKVSGGLKVIKLNEDEQNL